MTTERKRHSDEFALAATRVGPQLFRVAYRLLQDANLAEDAVAATYLRGWRDLHALHDRRKLDPWLRKICRREALRLRSERKRWLTLRPEQVDLAAASSSPDHEQFERLVRAELFAALPPNLRVCARMFFSEGFTYEEIVEATGLPLTTVRGRLRLSRDRLRREIDMTTNAPTMGNDTEEEHLRAERGRIRWEEASIRLLGVAWSDTTTVYDAHGKRLSRQPVTIGRAKVLPDRQDRPFDPDPHKGPTLSVFWEATGASALSMLTNAFSARTGTQCMPSSNGESRQVGSKRLLHFYCVPCETQGASLRLESLLMGAVDRESSHAYRWEFGFDRGLDVWISGAQPGWGAGAVFPPRPGKHKGKSEIGVALSSAVAERGCLICALDKDGRETDPSWSCGARVCCPEGHLHSEWLEFEIPPEDIYGLVIYPRHAASVDWGKVKVPPRPK